MQAGIGHCSCVCIGRKILVQNRIKYKTVANQDQLQVIASALQEQYSQAG